MSKKKSYVQSEMKRRRLTPSYLPRPRLRIALAPSIGVKFLYAPMKLVTSIPHWLLLRLANYTPPCVTFEM
jgi:hypothetical protein